MYGVVWKSYPNELDKTLGRGLLMYEITDVCHEFLEGNLGEQRLVCKREECVYHTADKKPTL